MDETCLGTALFKHSPGSRHGLAYIQPRFPSCFQIDQLYWNVLSKIVLDHPDQGCHRSLFCISQSWTRVSLLNVMHQIGPQLLAVAHAFKEWRHLLGGKEIGATHHRSQEPAVLHDHKGAHQMPQTLSSLTIRVQVPHEVESGRPQRASRHGE